MRKLCIAAIAALAAAVAAAPSTLGAPKPPTHVELLAFNDFHGHLEPNTPGRINDPVTGASVPAGGAEYFATHMKALGSGDPDTYVVSAGDMIGASPLLSGLFHDEPTIEVMNEIGVDINGVGNHEFDEGKAELLRMQDGPAAPGARPDGCHPVDGCQDGTPFFGSVFQFLAANVIDTSTNNPILPPYEIVTTSTGKKVAFIGETLEGTPLIVTPTGVAGLDFLDEADTANMLVPRLVSQGVRAIVLLLHQGGSQAAPFSRGFMDVNACENFTGPDLLDVVSRLDPQIDVVVSAHSHQPYICNINGRLVTSASSFGRLITSIDLTVNPGGQVVAATARNHVVTQTVARDAAITNLLARYQVIAAPIANRVVGSVTETLLSTRDPGGDPDGDGEAPLGNVIADAQLEATTPTDFGGAVIAFMNPGGIRGPILYDQISGGEQPGEVTYGELFTVQPFGNTLTVKTCTGAQIQALLEQQFDNPAPGSVRILTVSRGFNYSYDRTRPAGDRVLNETVKLNGNPIVETQSYRVEMNSFLASGGDGFSVFNQCTDQLGGEIDLDALVRYFTAHRPISPPTENRITRLG